MKKVRKKFHKRMEGDRSKGRGRQVNKKRERGNIEGKKENREG